MFFEKGSAMPHRQGSLDGLCGVYSIVNAMKLIRNDTSEESESLFNKIIYYLQDTNDLAKIILRGMSVKTLYKIINDVVDKSQIERGMPYRGKTESLQNVWSKMMSFMESSHNGLPTIIIGITWGENSGHWSVVRKITSKAIFLEDSDGMHRIYRSRITTVDPNSRRTNQLDPRELIFLNNASSVCM